MPRVLLLIPSATYRAPDFMAAAARMDVDVVVGSDRQPALAALTPGRTLLVPLATPELAAERIVQFARQYPLDAVVAVDDGGTLPAALAAARLGLPHNSFSGVEATRNKHLLRQRLARAELLSPPYRLVDLDETPERRAETLTAVEREVGFPCVVKPLSLSGSRGVMRADDRQALERTLARVAAILGEPSVAAECVEAATQALVEGYIPGEEVSLEGLLDDGELRVLALFDKPDPLVGPFFEETIYVTPSRLSAAVQAEVAAQAQRAAAALGLRDGPLHAELRINAEGAWPIDIAARSIGGLCSRALTFDGGLSLEELLVRHATGAAVPSYEREAGASGVMMVPIPPPPPPSGTGRVGVGVEKTASAGILESVHGVEEAKAVRGVTDVTIAIRPGQRVVPLPEGNEYLGFIFARSETPEEVEAALRQAHAALRFEIRREG